ncbi:MAG: hypothetical protein ABIK28_20820 [Planctomycetota bacterium]
MQEPGDTKQDGLRRQDPQNLEEVRVIHDVRPVRRGTGGLILLLVLLLGLVGAGYYYFFHMASSDTFASLNAEKGNFLALGWSFEPSASKSRDVADLWNFSSENDTFFSQVKNDARSGQYAIRVSLPEGGLARAVYAEPMEVNPRRQYTASAWIRVTGGAMVALKAVFLTSRGDEAPPQILYVDEFCAGRERSMKYVQIEGTVFPPPEATTLEFMVVAAGSGEVTVDDVALFEETSKPQEPSGQAPQDQNPMVQGQLGTSGVMDFYSCSGGYLVRRIGHTLFLGGRIVVIESTPGGEVAHETGLEGFHPDGEGYLYGGPNAGLFRAGRSLVVNAQMIQGGFTMPALVKGALSDVRYCFDLLDGYAEHGVGVLSNGEFILYGDAFSLVQAGALIFGSEQDRIKIVFKRPVTVLGSARKEGGVSVQCCFAPSEAIEFEFQIFSDFAEEVKEAQDLVQQALHAQQENRYGEALDLVDQIVKRYPYHEAVVHRSEELRGVLLGKKKDWLADLNERLRSAEFLNTSEQYFSVESACNEALSFFPNDRDFTQALDKVREKSSSLMNRIRDSKAEELYQIARNLYEAGGRAATLSEIQQYLQERFPASEWTRKAQTLGNKGKSE